MGSETPCSIHLLTPVVTEGLRTLDELDIFKSPGTQLTHSILRTGPPSIECEVDQALAVPGTIKQAIKAERNGASAVIIDCMGDPGLRPAREAVTIPVLGPAETSMHLAAMLGQKFCIVTVLESVRPMMMNNVRLYGVQEKLASIRVVDIPVLEIHQRGDEVQEALAGEALAAVEQDGADVIILGCTGFLGCADKIRKRLLVAKYDVPVIDPIPATFCMAEALVRSGLSHSKKAYPYFREKAFVGYEISRV
ncbi:hypothetical protein H2200_008466 [Cladophialophora chaetospira]|uniref:Hydrogenase expression protein HupH n=1 Tax=Cladophialophora chaetospira TaxID=386627 RepID=A0AA38X5T9_9EURO|nr:hypothetical protein H2200_008466 [Cladophialophora chaetospira]